ncbi:unnamed protein product [Rotaria sp. Silwood2]|nr:unnamed protein product [Rotaria sp. Silwood2]CAF4301230.1 unnamed protein product [Rotaria sp. Silwood2]CAF4311845.1 unnamed protein product [Rotaria sp. Silwood2]
MNFLENLLELNSHVHIHNDKRVYVEQTIRSLINDERKKLHVVADFDFTLTMYEKNGVALPSTFAVIEGDNRVTLPNGSLLRIQADQLRSKYMPIEHDVSMNVEEKLPYMIEWWHKAQSLIISSNLDKSMLHNVVYQSKMELKKGVRKFITDLLHSDVIEVFLEKEIPEFKHNHELSHVVSNFIEFDADGNSISFSKKLIHTFNKNEQEIHNTSYYQSILNRPNVILLGDTLGDVGMIGGMKNLKHVLKIGYLNHSTPTKLEVYKNVYDIVLCDDQTFDIPNLILEAI